MFGSTRLAGLLATALAGIAASDGFIGGVMRAGARITPRDVRHVASGYKRRGGGGSVKAHARAARKARNVRRHRAACRG